MSKIEEHIDRFVDEMNEECEDLYGVRYCYYEDYIYDKFCCDKELDIDDVIEADGEYIPVFNQWVISSGLFTDKAMKQRANEQRKENAADLATQAAEMGYHNYSSANGGTWYQD
jgi:hypothetical protein